MGCTAFYISNCRNIEDRSPLCEKELGGGGNFMNLGGPLRVDRGLTTGRHMELHFTLYTQTPSPNGTGSGRPASTWIVQDIKKKEEGGVCPFPGTAPPWSIGCFCYCCIYLIGDELQYHIQPTDKCGALPGKQHSLFFVLDNRFKYC